MHPPFEQLVTSGVCMQSAIGAGVEDTREVRQRLVALEGNVVKMQRADDKRAVEIMLKISEQEVSTDLWTMSISLQGVSCECEIA